MENEFWDIIGKAKDLSDDYDGRPENLKSILTKLSPEKIIQFKDHYYTKLANSYRWDLWGAAYTINGGCSDDGFDYWCDFLISEGKSVYENALENPESLAELEDIEDAELEDFRYAIEDAYTELTGNEFPSFTVNRSPEPIGDQWDEDNLSELYPKLNAKYGNV